MTATLVTGNSTVPVSLSSNSSLYVAPGATLLTTGSGLVAGAVIAVSDGQFSGNIFIDGTVGAFSGGTAVISAIFLGSITNVPTGVGANYLSIGTTGIVRASSFAIELQSTDNKVENAGLIAAEFTGILSASANNVIFNSGTIMAEGCLSMQGAGNTVTNSGELLGRSSGASFSGTGARLINSGHIEGSNGASLSQAGGKVDNSGSIVGVLKGLAMSGGTGALSNSGTIRATTDGVTLTGNTYEVLNEGTISGSALGLKAAGDDISVRSSGSIGAQDAEGVAVDASGLRFAFVNSGDVSGGLAAFRYNMALVTGGSLRLDNLLGGQITGAATGISIALGANSVAGEFARVTNAGDVSGSTTGIKALGDDISIRNSGSITAGDVGGFAVDATGFCFVLQNSGEVSGGLAAINYTATSLTGGTVRIDNLLGGQITGATVGIDINYGDDAVGGEFARLTNAGDIAGSSFGIRIKGLPVALLNSGTITAQNGVAVLSDSEQNVRLVNTGTITSALPTHLGPATAIDLKGVFGGGANELRNFGQIFGDVQMGDQVDLVRNRGLIDGDVRLDLGDDVYNGRGGHVTGTVFADIGNDTVTGGAEDDRFLGGQGNDVLNGRGGEDELRGGLGRDVLTGGIDADRFVFANANEAGNGANADRITDFQSGLDIIDFGFLPAGSYIGTGPFTNVAGQVRYTQATGLLECDTDGNGTANFSIVLENRVALTAADFVL